MTLIIELTPEQELRLDAAAKSEGLDTGTLAQRLVVEHLPAIASKPIPDARSQALRDSQRNNCSSPRRRTLRFCSSEFIRPFLVERFNSWESLIDLLRSWREEDATDDPQELKRRDSENQTLMMNLQANGLTLRLPEA